jgi:hypothetical protein
VAVVLGQHLHHPAVAAELHVVRRDPFHERPVGDVEDVAEPVAVGLVRAEQPERLRVAPVDVAHQLAQLAGRLGAQLGRPRHVDRVVPEIRQVEVAGENTAVGVRGGAHPQVTLGRLLPDQVDGHARGVEELLRPVRLEPLLQQGEVLGILPYAGEGHLMRAPGARHLDAVDLLGPGPALR